MARKRRKHSKIDKLSPELKATVEDMMKADFTYAEIADYIKDQTDQPISISSVCRYAANLNESVETLRMAQENFRVIMEEINKYPALDTSEGIIRLLSHTEHSRRKMEEHRPGSLAQTGYQPCKGCGV